MPSRGLHGAYGGRGAGTLEAHPFSLGAGEDTHRFTMTIRLGVTPG
jgi:hypothetical protein